MSFAVLRGNFEIRSTRGAAIGIHHISGFRAEDNRFRVGRNRSGNSAVTVEGDGTLRFLSGKRIISLRVFVRSQFSQLIPVSITVRSNYFDNLSVFTIPFEFIGIASVDDFPIVTFVFQRSFIRTGKGAVGGIVTGNVAVAVKVQFTFRSVIIIMANIKPTFHVGFGIHGFNRRLSGDFDCLAFFCKATVIFSDDNPPTAELLGIFLVRISGQVVFFPYRAVSGTDFFAVQFDSDIVLRTNLTEVVARVVRVIDDHVSVFVDFGLFDTSAGCTGFAFQVGYKFPLVIRIARIFPTFIKSYVTGRIDVKVTDFGSSQYIKRGRGICRSEEPSFSGISCTASAAFAGFALDAHNEIPFALPCRIGFGNVNVSVGFIQI